MNKQQAQEIIRDTFESSFDKSRFAGFIKNLLNRIDVAPFTYKGNSIPDPYKQYIKTLERIGKFSDGENNIDILVITLQKETSLERGRTMQRNFIAWYLNGSQGSEMKDAAFVAFVSPNATDWRFSLVKMDYKFEKTKTGRMKVKEEFTPARRWSFLVGANEKSHTAQSQLFDILANDEQAPTLNDIECRFDIEIVTREFFLKYRELFMRTKEELDKVVKNDPKIKADFEKSGVDTVNFAKKLLGQIVFLYFLQKKGWFGVGRDDDWGTGSKHFLRELFEKKHGDYKNFFNDVLEHLFYDALRDDRRHNDYYFSQFNCKIPFLNGGLFDPIGNYDWVHTDIYLPDKLFSNTKKTKEGDIGDGILDIFDRYNFTVKEDEPLEKEVAIDPELLGKAYEKFNAIRPDNYDEFRKALKSGKTGEENKFNKKFGVYYTPREIVHYMCQQSLINYLATELEGKLKKADIEFLILEGEKYIEHLKTAKDKKETDENYCGDYKEKEHFIVLKKYANEIDNSLSKIKVCDPAVGSGAFPMGMMSEIVKFRNVLSVFLNDKERTTYYFKRCCIEHSLYGVDIDPGAVEIAKLRLWLSLVVDEDDIKNIKPLPNLDYKLVCGNSLLGVEKDLFNDNLFSELERLKPLFFNETNPTKKQEYKNQIDKLISEITSGHKEFDFEVYFSEVFHHKGGFDVVIANPPYVDSENMVKNFPEERQKIAVIYNTASGNWDLYIPFFELGFNILTVSGNLTYIAPNKWLSIGYGKNLRDYLVDYIFQLCNCDSIKVFEAGNTPEIAFVEKKSRDEAIKIHSFNEDYIIIDKGTVPRKVLRLGNWGMVLSEKLDVLLTILNNDNRVYDYCDVENPFTVSEAYEVKKCVNEGEYGVHNENLMLITTGTIDKYISLWGKKKTSYIKDKYQYPFVDIKKFKRILPKRYEQSISTKIIIAGIRYFECFFDTNGNYVAGKSTIIIRNVNKNITFKSLLAILNSSLISFYIREAFSATGIGGGVNFTAPMINALPLPEINQPEITALDKLSSKVISVTDGKYFLDDPVKKVKVETLEREIDKLVYKLYGLTPEEIKIVEGENENAN